MRNLLQLSTTMQMENSYTFKAKLLKDKDRICNQLLWVALLWPSVLQKWKLDESLTRTCPETHSLGPLMITPRQEYIVKNVTAK